jgi:hypothetical protein
MHCAWLGLVSEKFLYLQALYPTQNGAFRLMCCQNILHSRLNQIRCPFERRIYNYVSNSQVVDCAVKRWREGRRVSSETHARCPWCCWSQVVVQTRLAPTPRVFFSDRAWWQVHAYLKTWKLMCDWSRRLSYTTRSSASSHCQQTEATVHFRSYKRDELAKKLNVVRCFRKRIRSAWEVNTSNEKSLKLWRL